MYPSAVRPAAYGLGLFATEDLKAGTPVEKFEGPIVRFSEIPEETVRYALLVGGDEWLVPHTNARFANHACEPNCRVADSLEIVTLAPVPRATELTFLYNGLTMEEALSPPSTFVWDPRWTFECRCGAPRCGGLIDRYVVRPAHDPNSATANIGLTRQKGRGVYASRDIRAGEMIERAPVLVIPAAEWEHVARSMLYNYTFEWGPEGEDAALAMGYGSFYNHSYAPNARYIRDEENLVIEFVALRDIARGEEIVMNYHGDPGDDRPLWFPAV